MGNSHTTLPKLTKASIQDPTLALLNRLFFLVDDRLKALEKVSPSVTTGNTASQSDSSMTVGDSLVLQGTHVVRFANFPASKFDSGVLFWETDRKLLYVTYLGGWYYVSGMTVNSLANRPSDLGTKDENVLFYASDRNIVYKWSGTVWRYFDGVENNSLANIPTSLTVNDVNYRFHATDYDHMYRWNGSSWAFADGDPGSGYIVLTSTNPPNGGLWAQCDGSSVQVAQSNGTISSVATPNVGTDNYLIFGAYAGIQAATPALITGNSGNAGAHTHDVTGNSGSAGSHSHTVDVDGTSVIQGAGSSVTVGDDGTYPTSGEGDHTHDSGTYATSSDGDHIHGVGTYTVAAADRGHQSRVALRAWMRR